MKKLTLSSRVRKALRGHSQGSTLIEIVIAMALLGIMGVAVLSALSTASLALITADKRATAESLARSQLEFVKNQGYNYNPTTHQGTYLKIPNIPAGYTIWSVNSGNQTVNGGATDPIIGIPWDSGNNKPAPSDTGLQKIALVIKHDGKEIFTFINNNPHWANGVKITLEGYKRG